MVDVKERSKAPQMRGEQASGMPHTIRKIGVVGAGQMGNGIAHVCALSGFHVLLNDVVADRISAGIATINGNLARQVSRQRISDEERQAAIKRITAANTIDELGDCDLVIEAATEQEDVKRKIFAALCPALKPATIVGTNTSSISITRLAAATDRPERFIGIHFMNPVPLMELVEVIRGIATDDATFEATKQFITKLGKQIAVSEDFPAFIVNRILLPMINEAIYTLYEGVGNVEAIDKAMRLGAHHPMGPLELADFIGLDTCLSVMQVLHEGLGRFQIPAVPAVGEIRRGRLARPQDAARLLRLSRRKAGADQVTRSGRRIAALVVPSSALAQTPARVPAAKFHVKTDLHGVNGGLFVERERYGRERAAGDRVGAEIQVEILGLHRQPRVKGIFDAAAGRPAVLRVAGRSERRQSERRGIGRARGVAVGPSAGGVEERGGGYQIADAGAHGAEPVQRAADIAGKRIRRRRRLAFDIGAVEIGFDAGNPGRRELPIVADLSRRQRNHLN